MSSNRSSGSGLGILEVVQIVFIILKVAGVVSWSWMWVLSPLWIGLFIVLFIWLVFHNS